MSIIQKDTCTLMFIAALFTIFTLYFLNSHSLLDNANWAFTLITPEVLFNKVISDSHGNKFNILFQSLFFHLSSPYYSNLEHFFHLAFPPLFLHLPCWLSFSSIKCWKSSKLSPRFSSCGSLYLLLGQSHQLP